jgi:hypothetical protein
VSGEKRTCMAPKRPGSTEICGMVHAAEFGDCPVHNSACRRHHKTPAAKAARKKSAKKGGRPPLSRPRKGARSPDLDDEGVLAPDEVETDVVGAVGSLHGLSDAKIDAVWALLQYDDLDAAARKLSIDRETLEQWVDEDLEFQKAHLLMQAYGPNRMRNFLAVGATIGVKRLVAVVSKTKNAELLLKVTRVLCQYHLKAIDIDLAAEIALLREQVEALEDDSRKAMEHS